MVSGFKNIYFVPSEHSSDRSLEQDRTVVQMLTY